MAEEGRGQRHSAPKVAPVTGQPFKSFDNAPRRTKRQKGQGMELQGIALFWFAPKFTPSKIFEPRKFFPACPLLPTKIFPFSTKKSRQKGLRPARPKACKVGQSILTDESADRDFSNRKKSLIIRLLAPTSPKAQKKTIFEWRKWLIGFEKRDIIYNGSNNTA